MDQPHIHLVDVAAGSGTAIQEFTETGIRMTDGREFTVDVVALTTGFDTNTGGLTNMGLQSIHRTTLKDEWKNGAYMYLGTTIRGYPNMFRKSPDP